MSKIKKNSAEICFIKMTGTGSNRYGFSLWPQWNTYLVISLWSDLEGCEGYLKGDGIVGRSLFTSNSSPIQYEKLAFVPISSKGSWDGYVVDPKRRRASEKDKTQESTKELLVISDSRIVVLTRASIRFSRLLRFWKQVPNVTKALAGQQGLIRSIGFGEYPIVRQATFSVWKDRESMVAFAYSGKHQEIIRRTHSEGWYSEEMFIEGKIIERMTSFSFQ